MLLHLVATLTLAVVSCLTLWALGRAFRRALPGYALPMVAASVAIGYGVYAEYSWAARMESGLPASVVVLKRVEERSALAPWSWLVPRVVRLSAVDTSAVRHHASQPGLSLVEVLLLQRFEPLRRLPQLVDCIGGRRADLPADGALGADGLPTTLAWRTLEPDDALGEAACESAR